MTEKQLKVLCRQWQKRLKLQDWDISIKFVRGFDMGTDQGEFCPLNEKRAALIKVLDPRDVGSDWIVPYDIEWTIVHELIHAHFEPFWRDKKRMEQEQAINAITSALIATKRR